MWNGKKEPIYHPLNDSIRLFKKTTTTSYKELFHTNHANMIHASGGGVCPPQLSKHCYVVSRKLRIAQTDIIITGVCLFH